MMLPFIASVFPTRALAEPPVEPAASVPSTDLLPAAPAADPLAPAHALAPIGPNASPKDGDDDTEEPPTGKGYLTAGAILLGTGGGTFLIGFTSCLAIGFASEIETAQGASASRSPTNSSADACLITVSAIGVGLLISSIPFLVVGGRLRSKHRDWLRDHPDEVPTKERIRIIYDHSFLAPVPGGFALGWRAEF